VSFPAPVLEAAAAVYEHTPWAAAAAVLPWALLAWVTVRLVTWLLDRELRHRIRVTRINGRTEGGLRTVNDAWLRHRCRAASKEIAAIVAAKLERPELLFMLRAVLQGELQEVFEVEDDQTGEEQIDD